MPRSRDIDRLLAEESAEWTERLKRGDRRTRAAFARWSRKSPLHMRHFLMMVALDHELERMDPGKRIELPRLHAQNSAEIIELTQASSRAQPRRRRLLGWMAIAASVLLAVAVLLYFPQLFYRAQGWDDYATAPGEQRAFELADGSIAHLNTQSEILVKLSRQERQVRLLTGEALFKVQHDTSRPFRVYSGDATIQAVGTQFNVYRQPAATKVSVLEGRVKVAKSGAEKLLGAGEAAEVRAGGTISETEVVDVETIAAWRQRRLVFRQEPLATVVSEFNRYNHSPRFRLVGADVAARRYSGAFDADDPESLVALLEIDRDLNIQRNGDEIIIRARNPATSFAQSP